MQFSRGRMAKLAGLLREGVEEEDDKVKEADEMEEAEEADEVDEAEMDERGGVYEIDEKGMEELEESFDLRRAIRDEIRRALDSRDENTSRYTSGQVFGKRTKNYGTVTMGFPGIGFKR